MPTYGYECPECGVRQQQRCSISAHVDTKPCACGGTAEQTFDVMPEFTVSGNQRSFKLDHGALPIGWQHGNTGAKQEERYSKLIQDEKKQAKANDKYAIKQGWRKIAAVPREIFRDRSRQFGKDYLDPSAQSNHELKQKLKSDDLLLNGE